MAAEGWNFHAVRFYKDALSLADIVCPFLAEGLTRGEPAVLIATEAHTKVFTECFAARRVNVEIAVANGSLTLLDAEQILDSFMRGGIPMSQPFADTMTPILRSIEARFPGAVIRAYGEMVDILWKRDHTAAAIRLEMLWNDLARSHRFRLLCGYAMGNFYKGLSAGEICGLHSHVVTDTGAHIALT